MTKNLPLFSSDLFAVTPIIVDFFQIDFDLFLLPNSVYICTSANLRGLTRARRWATVRETLATHHVNTIVLPTDGDLTLRIRQGSTPEAAHRELYQKLGISSEIIPPRKTWSNSVEGSA